jgi:hypothetical protein
MTRYLGYGVWFTWLMVAGASSSIGAGCPQGTVWREATPDDHVCVSPGTRAQVWNDNAKNPHETCPRGLVWREATPQDHVCVTPAIRTRTWNDNIHAPRDTFSPIPQRID